MPRPQETIVDRTPMYAQVALPVPVATAFTYEVPPELAPRVFVGCRVDVPFGRRFLKGFVVALSERSDVARTKPIREVLETHLTGPLLDLVGWMASYYGCSLGEAAQAVIPPSFKRSSRKRRVASANGAGPAGGPLPGPSPLEAFDSPVEELTADQDEALGRIGGSISKGYFSVHLLHGVTGSGKTEIYLRAAGSVLSGGGGCIVLVPEISLLPQAVARYRKVFGSELAVIHSRLSGTERFEIWSRVEQGACRVVLGPRSAVFSPVVNLKLIIVDE
jgi:primosomal protein N' (replication factor Y)